MPFRKWLKEKNNNSKSNQRSTTISAMINGNRQQSNRVSVSINNEKPCGEDISIIYFASDSPIKTLVDILQSMSENEAKVNSFDC
jgi:hypothetical protein